MTNAEVHEAIYSLRWFVDGNENPSDDDRHDAITVVRQLCEWADTQLRVPEGNLPEATLN